MRGKLRGSKKVPGPSRTDAVRRQESYKWRPPSPFLPSPPGLSPEVQVHTDPGGPYSGGPYSGRGRGDRTHGGTPRQRRKATRNRRRDQYKTSGNTRDSGPTDTRTRVISKSTVKTHDPLRTSMPLSESRVPSRNTSGTGRVGPDSTPLLSSRTGMSRHKRGRGPGDSSDPPQISEGRGRPVTSQPPLPVKGRPSPGTKRDTSPSRSWSREGDPE